MLSKVIVRIVAAGIASWHRQAVVDFAGLAAVAAVEFFVAAENKKDSAVQVKDLRWECCVLAAKNSCCIGLHYCW